MLPHYFVKKKLIWRCLPLLKCLRTHYGWHCEPFSGQNTQACKTFHIQSQIIFRGDNPDPLQKHPQGLDPDANFRLANQLPVVTVLRSASEMTYIVSGGALNSTHSLTPVLRNDHCWGPKHSGCSLPLWGSGGITPHPPPEKSGDCVSKILQFSAFWPENGSKCRP